eukprot:scaffold137678_cov19-Prasinocladus_malaysianus.AAC.1
MRSILSIIGSAGALLSIGQHKKVELEQNVLFAAAAAARISGFRIDLCRRFAYCQYKCIEFIIKSVLMS